MFSALLPASDNISIDVETVLTAPATCIALPIFFAVSLSLSLRNRRTACDAKAADTSLE